MEPTQVTHLWLLIPIVISSIPSHHITSRLVESLFCSGLAEQERQIEHLVT